METSGEPTESTSLHSTETILLNLHRVNLALGVKGHKDNPRFKMHPIPASLIQTDAERREGWRFLTSFVERTRTEQRKLALDIPQRPQMSMRKLPDADAVLIPSEVAVLLDIPRKTVIMLCAAKRLFGAKKIGRQWRIPGWGVRAQMGVT